uniref:Chemokine interleukin-8-like domain-containing protein n=1 Tax=Anser brachyrhynchus TaxID=132585 RepID=A0A8B9I3Q0_9AVES
FLSIGTAAIVAQCLTVFDILQLLSHKGLVGAVVTTSLLNAPLGVQSIPTFSRTWVFFFFSTRNGTKICANPKIRWVEKAVTEPLMLGAKGLVSLTGAGPGGGVLGLCGKVWGGGRGELETWPF